ncbi:MAG: hypothetical protein KDB79_10890 [Acidobacteria bacterium]|nr:hypothetical protein [Acidobacteriota bacterium]
MSKTEKEIAFLRGLYVDEVWTSKFTDIFDENFKFEEHETFLYLNAGTGNHALAVNERLAGNSLLFAVCENEHLQEISQRKATTLNVELDFSTSMPLAESEFVLADASFIKPEELDDFIAKLEKLSARGIAFFLPTAGSFGEVFSFLWEVFVDLDIPDKGTEIERLIANAPTVSKIEEVVGSHKLKKFAAKTKNEYLEFETGKDFIESPLIGYFLLPNWLDFLTEKEKEQVMDKLAQKIDDERDGLSFRCSIKATLVTARKP